MKKIFILITVFLLLLGCNNKPKVYNTETKKDNFSDTLNKNIEYSLEMQRYFVGAPDANPNNGYLLGTFRCENCGFKMSIWIGKGYQWKDILPSIVCPKCNVNICTVETVQKYNIVSGD